MNFQAPRENLMNNLSTADSSLLLEFWDHKMAQFDTALQENALLARAIATYSKQLLAHHGIFDPFTPLTLTNNSRILKSN
jgi:hypothetical protein